MLISNNDLFAALRRSDGAPSSTDKDSDNFIAKVVANANHHAPNVAAVITSLSNAARARLNLAIDQVEVYERTANLSPHVG
ncbi:hypothetical protein HFN69_22060 [Rhizobium laguerreae]|nr:hypothetical protein [Rhizobium laguerreae]MBY3549263.1 hypothetical protein [Rhizobium laguerreae]